MTTPASGHLAAALAVPAFDVALTAPDISLWREGNTGIEGFVTLAGAAPGPHVALVSLIHGNEIAGAIVLDRLLRLGLQPSRGRLTFGFANLDAFERFDPAQPTASRFLDEDLNRLWDPAVLDGPRQSSELARARIMRPLIDGVDVLLDLHSMLWPSVPLTLSGATAKGQNLALAIGQPPLVVSDAGHVSGARLIDYPRFADPDTAPVANLIEAGQHWQPETVDMTLAGIAGLLRHMDMILPSAFLPPALPVACRLAKVTLAVTAATAGFTFVQPFRGGDVIPRRNTLIALDGSAEVRTPHDDCLLVMPSLRPSRGHTAVRLGRFVT